jgi:Derlin-2/3
MHNHLSLPTLLQLPNCLHTEPGTPTSASLSCTLTLTYHRQYWRLVTTFFYFGPLSLDLLYHIFFLQRYSRLLEESSGRSPAHFSWLLTFASTLLLCIAPIFSMAFLGSALSSTLIYIWSRKNPDTMLSFLGLVVFKAPYLPWVLLAFSLVMHGTVPKDEMCGIVVGHSMSLPFLVAADR